MVLYSEHLAVKDISLIAFRKAIPMWKSNIACQSSVIFRLLLEIYGCHCRLRGICILTWPQIYFASFVRRRSQSSRQDNFSVTRSHRRFCLNNRLVDRWDSSVLFPSLNGRRRSPWEINFSSFSRQPDRSSYNSQFIKPTIWSRRAPWRFQARLAL